MDEQRFKIVSDRFGKPLIIWVNPPGLDAEFSPEQLKELALVLLELANTVIENQ